MPLDGFVRLACHLCQAPIGAITEKVGAHHRLMVSVGDGAQVAQTVIGAEPSLLRETEEITEGLLIVCDLAQRAEFAVHKPDQVRFFAAVPLRDRNDQVFGVLWIADHDAREENSQLSERMNGLCLVADEIVRVVENQHAMAEAPQAVKEQDLFFILAADMLCTAGIDGYFKRLNPAWEQTLGYTQDELLAEPLLAFVHPDDQAATIAEMEKLATGAHSINFENRYRCRDGSYKWLAWTSRSAGENGLIYASARDITSQKAIEEELAAQSKELNRSNEELERFAYVASHDLQEPLRMVASYMQLLAKRYQGHLDSDADEFIAFAVDGAKRMQKLIDDLLIYSRLNRRANSFTPTDSNAALERALADLQYAVLDTKAVITHDPLPMIMANPSEIAQLFQNILANSLKFHSAEPPRIHVTVETNNNDHIFSISDNGIGIAPEYFERIFILFQRLHTQADYPGTGIGLALCKKIVEKHDGRIWVTSEPDKGTTLFLTVPVRTLDRARQRVA